MPRITLLFNYVRYSLLLILLTKLSPQTSNRKTPKRQNNQIYLYPKQRTIYTPNSKTWGQPATPPKRKVMVCLFGEILKFVSINTYPRIGGGNTETGGGTLYGVNNLPGGFSNNIIHTKNTKSNLQKRNRYSNEQGKSSSTRDSQFETHPHRYTKDDWFDWCSCTVFVWLWVLFGRAVSPSYALVSTNGKRQASREAKPAGVQATSSRRCFVGTLPDDRFTTCSTELPEYRQFD